MNQSLLAPFGTAEERVKNALEAFKQGNGVLVLDDENRENEGDLIFPAETITVRFATDGFQQHQRKQNCIYRHH